MELTNAFTQCLKRLKWYDAEIWSLPRNSKESNALDSLSNLISVSPNDPTQDIKRLESETANETKLHVESRSAKTSLNSSDYNQ